MKKTGVAELLKKGRYVALVGNLHIWENTKDGRSYINHDIRVISLDVPSLGGGEWIVRKFTVDLNAHGCEDLPGSSKL